MKLRVERREKEDKDKGWKVQKGRGEEGRQGREYLKWKISSEQEKER